MNPMSTTLFPLYSISPHISGSFSPPAEGIAVSSGQLSSLGSSIPPPWTAGCLIITRAARAHWNNTESAGTATESAFPESASVQSGSLLSD
jgi:hypothetical protein